MINDDITPSWPVRIWHAFKRLCSDIAYLFDPNKLFVYSWMKYEGVKMLNNNWGDDINKLISIKAKNNFKEINRDLATALVERESYQVIF